MAQLGAGSGTDYPSAIDTVASYVNGANPLPDSNARVDAELLNDLLLAIEALQITLGANPQGSFASVRARLDGLAPPTTTPGGAETTVAANTGATTLTSSALIPANARIEAVFIEVDTSFGTSNGLTAIHVGGLGLLDRWGSTIALTAGTRTGFQDFTTNEMPTTTAPTAVTITAASGTFDSVGSLTVTAEFKLAP
jgi:hypothetical protein